MTSVAYDRRGRYFAVGYDDGQISIWDMTTTGFVTSLLIENEEDEDLASSPQRSSSFELAVEEMSWGPRSRRLLVTYANCPRAILWLLDSKGNKKDRTNIEIPNYPHGALGSAILHPKLPNIALVCPSHDAAPLLCRFDKTPHRFDVLKDTTMKWSRPIATFMKRYPNLVLAASGDRKDSIFVADISTQEKNLKRCEGISFSQFQIYDIVISKSAKLVLLQCSDRAVRLCMLTIHDDDDVDDDDFEDEHVEERKIKKGIKIKFKKGSKKWIQEQKKAEERKRKAEEARRKRREELRGRKTMTRISLTLLHQFVDTVNTRQSWYTPCFSGDSEYVVAAGSDDGEIYIWNTSGRVIRKLPSESAYCTHTVWHPRRPTIAAVNSKGHVSVWSKQFKPQWTAFAPNFDPVERNTQYREREDEFDLWNDDVEERKREKEKNDVKESRKGKDEYVDIMSTERVFSSDDEDDYIFPVVI